MVFLLFFILNKITSDEASGKWTKSKMNRTFRETKFSILLSDLNRLKANIEGIKIPTVNKSLKNVSVTKLKSAVSPYCLKYFC